MCHVGALRRSALICTVLLAVNRSNAGKVVVSNDDQTFNPLGFLAPNDAERFATNIGEFFSGGQPGNLLAYSNHPGLTGTELAVAMTSAGHTWTVSTSLPFDVPTLLTYDGVFIGGFGVDTNILSEYVAAGGNVYLMAGTGPDGPFGDYALEAAFWNTFLAAQGLALFGEENFVTGSVSVASPHPLMNGVDALYQSNGQDIGEFDPDSIFTEILVPISPTPGVGLYAVSVIPDPPPPVPNDECHTATPVGIGTMPFSNVGATSGGPFEEFPCGGVGSDVWFSYTAACSGGTVVDLCDSSFGFDTLLYVYSECPELEGVYVACNDDRCGEHSRTDFFASAGQTYLIRIGGFEGIQSDGTMTIMAEFSVPPGDLNLDGSVSLADLAVLLAHFGTASGATYADGDLDFDQDVDLSDLALLLANFGSQCS